MKFFNIILFSFAVLFFSCEKDKAFTEFNDLEKGAYARVLDGPNGILDFEDPSGSGIDFEVEFYDENEGQNAASYNWEASFPGFGPATVASTSAPYSTNANGYPGTSISFTFQDVLDALGMTLDDIILGEQFSFIGTLTTTNGQTFTNTNTGGNVVSSAPYSAFFSFKKGVENLPCIHKLSGTFDAVVKVTDQGAGIGWDGCGGNEWTGTVRWEAVHNEDEFGAGLYNIYTTDEVLGVEYNDASFGAYYACYGSTSDSSLPNGTDGAEGDVQINFDCNKGFFSGSSQWGEAYMLLDMEANGAELKFKWTNDYGEGAEVTLTRTDGQNWPDDMRS